MIAECTQSQGWPTTTPRRRRVDAEAVLGREKGSVHQACGSQQSGSRFCSPRRPPSAIGRPTAAHHPMLRMLDKVLLRCDWLAASMCWQTVSCHPAKLRCQTPSVSLARPSCISLFSRTSSSTIAERAGATQSLFAGTECGFLLAKDTTESQTSSHCRDHVVSAVARNPRSSSARAHINTHTRKGKKKIHGYPMLKWLCFTVPHAITNWPFPIRPQLDPQSSPPVVRRIQNKIKLRREEEQRRTVQKQKRNTTQKRALRAAENLDGHR